MLRVLEDAYERLDRLLGLRPRRKIDVVIYDPGIFDRSFAGLFRFSAAGFYHGVIRIRGDVRVTPQLQRILHHELVHAAVDAEAPSLVLPGWLNEGLAEWFEARALGKRGLNGGEWSYLSRAHRQGALLPLSSLSVPTFGRLGPAAARTAYLQSYAMVDHLARAHGERALRQFCRELMDSGNLQHTLRRVYRTDIVELDREFRSEFG